LVHLAILNPIITVIFMAKFNLTITAYLAPYKRGGYDNKKFCYWVSLLLKVEHISYTIGTCTLPDIYSHLPLGLILHVHQNLLSHGKMGRHTMIHTDLSATGRFLACSASPPKVFHMLSVSAVISSVSRYCRALRHG